MSLVQYHKKRNFTRTREPRGKVKRSKGTQGTFVIQKHDASHLHYDFRLELDGVLKSWAVPKGPSLDPKIKRLAVEVEDHPVEYGSFEGIIPEGQYGGGTVMLWDRGHWTPEGDPQTGVDNGRLKFELHGEKLHGKWMLVRSSRQTTGKPQWLLFKLPDEEAKPESKIRIVDEEPLSVASGRDLEEIAANKSRVWHSNGKASRRASVKSPKTKRAKTSAKSRRMPRFVEPELATLVESAPEGDDWLHEIKFDGYRMLCYINDQQVRLETRNRNAWTKKLPELVAAAQKLNVEQAIFDGEVVAINDKGLTDFQALQNAFRDANRTNVVYCVFDLLFLNGEDLRDFPLEERKAKLKALKLPTSRGHIRYTEHVVGNGPTVMEQARENGLEGIISKRLGRPYVEGRGADWLKVKCQQNAEFVIGGYTDPDGARQGFGALLLGYFEDGTFQYAGRVGTGFSDKSLAELLAQLKPLEQKDSPFDAFPPRGRRPKGVHWVKPKLVAQIRFSNWTREKLLRHPAFQGLREDKPAELVKRESAKKLSVATKETPTKKRKTTSRAKKSAAPAKTHAPDKKNQPTEIHGVRVTHPDKILYPDEGITKRDLAEYYLLVADRMLPYVKSRPLAIVRCPDGIEGERFFQKHPGHVAPEELHRVTIREKQGNDTYLTIENAEGLVALAQISAVEIHVWGSKTDMIEKPDVIVLDLDPAPDVTWKRVIAAAIELRDFLGELGLKSFVKTSGGKGLHLCVPLRRAHAWPAVREFSELIARTVERIAPDRYVANMSKKRRVGKIFVDYLRNERGSTSIAAFSTRAKPAAPLSVPLTWKELPRIKSADQFQLRNISKRLKSLRRDPWEGYDKVDQQITKAMIDQLQTD